MPTSSGRITAPFGPNLWSNDEPNGKGEISKKNSSCVQFSSTSAANDELCYMDACIHCHIYNTSALLPVVQKNLVDKNKKPTSGGCPAPWIEIRGFYYYYSFPTLYSSVPEAVKACRTIHPDATLPLDPLGGIKEYMDSLLQLLIHHSQYLQLEPLYLQCHQMQKASQILAPKQQYWHSIQQAHRYNHQMNK
uniref:C-type lectin domain-containing protein n=1 Tax=Romanomermis culicivorax TaxID=13658 RepID=A0A915J725_ROMCU